MLHCTGECSATQLCAATEGCTERGLPHSRSTPPGRAEHPALVFVLAQSALPRLAAETLKQAVLRSDGAMRDDLPHH